MAHASTRLLQEDRGLAAFTVLVGSRPRRLRPIPDSPLGSLYLGYPSDALQRTVSSGIRDTLTLTDDDEREHRAE